jgi:DNA-binding NarL/FixJ family response regulator
MARLKLLLVEDHELVGQGLRAMLGERYNVVALIRDGREVLDAVRLHAPNIILLDLSLPGRTGVDLIPDIRALNDSVRILVVTMHADPVLADHVLRHGAHGFVPKNAPLRELEEAIATVADGRIFLSRRVPAHSNKQSWSGQRLGFAQLTQRQQTIVRLFGKGKTSEQVAEETKLSLHTVWFHRRNIKRVLGIETEADFAQYCLLVHLSDEEHLPDVKAGPRK